MHDASCSLPFYPQPGLFFLYAAQFFGCSFLFLNIHQTGDHDPLCLGRSGAVHGFRQISYSGCAQREIFNQSQNADSVFGRNVGVCPVILLQPLSGFRGFKVLLTWQGDRYGIWYDADQTKTA